MDKERELFETWYLTGVKNISNYHTLELLENIKPILFMAWQESAKLVQWQPIETIPKDGTEVIVRYGRQGNVKQLVFYNTVHNFWSSKGEVVFGLMENATEWMNIPE